MRIAQVFTTAAVLLAAVTVGATGPASAAMAAVPQPAACTYEVVLDFAPYLSTVTTSRHVIGSGKLSGCAGLPNAFGDEATFRVVGDGPANCLGQKFHLYQEIYWDNGEYSLVELKTVGLLGIGLHAGSVIDYGYTGSKTQITSLPQAGFLGSCLAQGGVHQLRFSGVQFFAHPA
jgi:hypothetical protein